MARDLGAVRALHERATDAFGPVGGAVAATIAYADVFDHPLSAAEIHRFLPFVAADRDTVAAALTTPGTPLPTLLTARDGRVAIAGRERAFDVHRRRVATSSRLWLRALRWSAILARIPFVRMVAVTGSLALHNADAGDDIDFLVIAEDDRVWSCRLNVMLLRAATRRSEQLCFNYFLAERAVALDRRDLYTARELGQMVPVYGWSVYRDMLEANDWMRTILPNVTPRLPMASAVRAARSRAVAETMLRAPVASRVERLERERCRRKFARAGHLAEARFDGDCYQDHGHGPSILAAFSERLDGLVSAA